MTAKMTLEQRQAAIDGAAARKVGVPVEWLSDYRLLLKKEFPKHEALAMLREWHKQDTQ